MDRNKNKILLCSFLICVSVSALLLLGTPGKAMEDKKVMIIEIEGAISPGSASFLVRGIKEADAQNAALIIVRLDTPGGLGSSMALESAGSFGCSKRNEHIGANRRKSGISA